MDEHSRNQPLGRGLEQISHLFLSQRANDLRAGMPQTRSPARAVALQRNTSITKTELVAMLREVQDTLEEGLRVIDVFLPCHPHGEIDLLALDRENHLTIIDFEMDPNDALVLRGMAHFDWLLHNLPIVRRMHAEPTMDLSAQPRLFLLAPQFSSLSECAARCLTQPKINWVRYTLLETGGATGIFFDPMVLG